MKPEKRMLEVQRVSNRVVIIMHKSGKSSTQDELHDCRFNFSAQTSQPQFKLEKLVMKKREYFGNQTNIN